MMSDTEVLQKARALMAENDFKTAEQVLLDGIATLPPKAAMYNCLMELYFVINQFEKVAEYFKETTDKFPDIELNSYLMVAHNLMTKNAFKESELILFLALQNHPEQRPITANKLLELYLQSNIPGIVAFNFIKENFRFINLSSDACTEVLRRLSIEKHEEEHREFYIFLYNISATNTVLKELFTEQYLKEINNPDKALATFDIIFQNSSIIEPSIFIIYAISLLQQGESTEAINIFTKASLTYLGEASLFNEIKVIINEAPDSSKVINEILARVVDTQLTKILNYTKDFEFDKVLEYIKLLYPSVSSNRQPDREFQFVSQVTVCQYYEAILSAEGKTSLLCKNNREEILSGIDNSTNKEVLVLAIIDAVRSYYEAILHPDREEWKSNSFANSSIPISDPVIGMLTNEPQTKTVTNVRSFNNKFGLYDQTGVLIPETFHFTFKGLDLKPNDANFASPVSLPTEEIEYNNIDEPVLFLGYTFHGQNYESFLLQGLNCAWYLVENDWKGKVYFQFQIDNAISGTFGHEVFRPLAIEILELAGIDKSQIIIANDNTKFAEVIIPEIGYRMNSYAYKDHNKLFQMIAKKALSLPITANVLEVNSDSKLYLSHTKQAANGFTIIGETMLEECLQENGYTIIHPEELTVTEQIQIYNRATIIVGAMDSSLLTSLFSLNTPAVHTLCLGAVNTNYPLAYSLTGITEQHYHDVIKRITPPEKFNSQHLIPNYFDIDETLKSLKSTGAIKNDYLSPYSNQDIERMITNYFKEIQKQQ